jgi:hypothetical protein
MNPESEDFDSLRRLLALKRYELPPPGYFNRFSRDVMARIKVGEKGGTVGIESTWLQRLLSLLDVKPIFAGAFGTAVCAFVISGVISERAPAVGAMSPTSMSPSVAAAIPTDVSMPGTEVSPSPIEAQVVAAGTNSGSLFDQFSAQPRQVSDRLYFPNN